ncbi:hypothetical protein [Echinicola salinicaeni]|uniref:hypothetical protein n=1 Tax=Echinicola salinicaeni TaxID=2762757 RepID=UPI001644FB75|nr:hypothetical protein [Echinicola salinicaeni]
MRFRPNLIRDEFSLEELQERSELHFMTLNEPKEISPGIFKLGEKSGKSILLKYPKSKVESKVELWEMKDERLRKVWKQKAVYRLVFFQKGEKLSDEWNTEVIIE